MLTIKFLLWIIFLLCGLSAVLPRDLPGTRDDVTQGAERPENKPDPRVKSNCEDCGPHAVDDETENENIQRHPVNQQQAATPTGVQKSFIQLHNLRVKVHSGSEHHHTDADATKGVSLQEPGTPESDHDSKHVDSHINKRPNKADSKSEFERPFEQNKKSKEELVSLPDNSKLKGQKHQNKDATDEAVRRDGANKHAFSDQAPSNKEQGHAKFTATSTSNMIGDGKGGEEMFVSQIEKELKLNIPKTYNRSEINKFFNMYEEYLNQKGRSENRGPDTKSAEKGDSPTATERPTVSIKDPNIKRKPTDVHTIILGSENKNTEDDIIVNDVTKVNAQSLNTKQVQNNLMQNQVDDDKGAVVVNSKPRDEKGNTVISKTHEIKTDKDTKELNLVNSEKDSTKPDPKQKQVTSKSQKTNVEKPEEWMDYDIDAPNVDAKTHDKQMQVEKEVKHKATVHGVKTVKDAEVRDKQKQVDNDGTNKDTVQDGKTVKDADDVDVIIPVKQQDRWWKEGLDQVPDAARLEQKLHPMVDAPVRDIIHALRNMLLRVQHQLTSVQYDFSDINNITRWRYMTGVREQLTFLAEQNDYIYNVMLESALLTKQIYRRAHERRHPVRFRYDAAPVADMRYKSQKSENAAHEELRHAEAARRQVVGSMEKWNVVHSENIRMSQTLGDYHPIKALHDLERRANHTMRAVHNARLLLDPRPSQHVVRNSSSLGTADLRYLVTKATAFIDDTKNNLMESKSVLHEIRDVRRHMSSTPVADMTFDERRVVIWSHVDSANMHADSLLQEAGMIHMKLSPLIRRARAILEGKASSGAQRQLQSISNTLSRDVKELTRVLDKIRVIVGDRKFLRERCEHVEGSGAGMDDNVDDVINCPEYIEESSGDNGETDLPEGSGEAEALTVDLDGPDILGPTEAKTDDNIADLKLNPDEILLIDEDPDANADLPTAAPQTAASTKPKIKDKNPSVTSKHANTRAARSEDSGDFVNLGISDPFGNFSPDPAEITAIKSIEGSHEAAPDTLNAAIRKRLFGYVKTGLGLLNQSRILQTRVQDLSKNWSDVSRKFAAIENITQLARSTVLEFKAKAIYVRTSHDHITDVVNNIDTQASVIDSQCKAAVQTAERKLNEYRKYSAENQDTSGQAPDPVAVQQAVNAVKQTSANANEIVRLTELHPDPCGAAERHDSRIRSNITRLREQIERARTIAATLQLSVALPKDKQLQLPVPEHAAQDRPLSAHVHMMVRPADVSGHLMTIKYNETGSVSLHLKNRLPVLKQTFDGNDVTADGTSPLETDVWYKVMLERFATSHRLTVKDTSGKESSISVNFTKPFEDLDRSRATSVLLGDPKNSMGCAGGLSFNSRILALDGAVPGSCPSSVVFHPKDMSVVLDGTGFTLYNLDRHRSIRDLELQFTAYSDGEVLSFQSRYMTTKLHALVQGGKLFVQLRHNNVDSRLVSKHPVYGERLTLKVNTANIRGGSVTINGNPDLLEASEALEAAESFPEVEGLVLGSTLHNRSSIVGCYGRLSVNGQEVGLQMFESVEAASFGQCQDRSCVTFSEQSTRLELGEVTEGSVLHVAVGAGALGQVVRYSRKNKFDISVILNSNNGVDIEESLEDKSDAATLHRNNPYHTISILDMPGNEKVQVVVGGRTFDFKYKGSGTWGWGAKREVAADDAPYQITVGGNSELPFLGDLSELMIGLKPIPLQNYTETSNLQGCATQLRKRPPIEQPKLTDRTCGIK